MGLLWVIIYAILGFLVARLWSRHILNVGSTASYEWLGAVCGGSVYISRSSIWVDAVVGADSVLQPPSTLDTIVILLHEYVVLFVCAAAILASTLLFFSRKVIGPSASELIPPGSPPAAVSQLEPVQPASQTLVIVVSTFWAVIVAGLLMGSFSLPKWVLWVGVCALSICFTTGNRRAAIPGVRSGWTGILIRLIEAAAIVALALTALFVGGQDKVLPASVREVSRSAASVAVVSLLALVILRNVCLPNANSHRLRS